MSDWPALRRWSVDYFAAALGEKPVPVGILPRPEDVCDAPDSFPWPHLSRTRIPLKDYADLLASPECHRYYITAMTLNKYLPEPQEDFVPPPVLEEVSDEPVSPRLWFGKEVLGPLHYDTINNLH